MENTASYKFGHPVQVGGFKVGDTVIVVSNNGKCRHYWPMGTVGVVFALSSALHVRCKPGEVAHTTQWIHPEDARLYESVTDDEGDNW
jgi:hypothetical protein